MSKSIIQDESVRECYLCRMEAADREYYGELPHTGLHKHHFIHGTANRKYAEQYGLWAYLCMEKHHEYGSEAPHVNAEVDRRLKRIAQARFEEIYSREKFMEVFKKNWIV